MHLQGQTTVRVQWLRHPLLPAMQNHSLRAHPGRKLSLQQ